MNHENVKIEFNKDGREFSSDGNISVVRREEKFFREYTPSNKINIWIVLKQ